MTSDPLDDWRRYWASKPKLVENKIAGSGKQDWERYWSEANANPDWVKARQLQAVNTLAFHPVKRTKAKPLDHTQLMDALYEYFDVVAARELKGLDVWFLETKLLTTGLWYDMILYEHRGDWHCLCVDERKTK